MLRSIVCDAGGVLVAGGALDGVAPDGAEILALDWTAMTVGRFLAAHYEGNPTRTRVELGVVLACVHEWFPVRTLVADTLERAGLEAVDSLDTWSALLLAEQLDLPLLTASDEASSNQVQILRPW